VGSLRIDNALVFDGFSEQLQEGSILVVDGTIAGVGLSVGKADQVLDAAGCVVLPGLIDAHLHAYGTTFDMLELDGSPLSYLALAAGRRLRRTLERGFTTVRDVAGGDIGLSTALRHGLLLGPRYLYTGAALSQTGGHGDSHPAHLNLCAHGSHVNEVVDGVEALRRAVRSRFRAGAHAIKIMASGGVMSPTDPIRVPQYSADEIRAVADEATRRGSYVAAHAYSPEAIVHAVTNGVRTIEHGNLLDEEAAEVMRQHEAYLVPTLAAYDAMSRRGADIGLSAIARAKNEDVLDAGKRAVETARAAGVQIGFGTDLMGALEDDQLQGLRLQIEADGVLNTLRAVTSVNAAIIRRDDLGSVAPGCAGDLVVLGANPFDEPSALWSERCRRTVIQSGRVVAGQGADDHPRGGNVTFGERG
jgi:imidazolonepropionase-like amidohydrolase